MAKSKLKEAAALVASASLGITAMPVTALAAETEGDVAIESVVENEENIEEETLPQEETPAEEEQKDEEESAAEEDEQEEEEEQKQEEDEASANSKTGEQLAEEQQEEEEEVASAGVAPQAEDDAEATPTYIAYSKSGWGIDENGHCDIPEGTTKIPYREFNGKTSLKSLTIPDTVTSIEMYAFQNCTSLSNIFIPDSVTSIGTGAFSGCTSLADFIVPSGITSIYSEAFKGCTSLANIIIPEGVTGIGSSAFYNCSSLKNIDLPKSITSIGASAFSGAGITNIDMPDSITTLGASVFKDCHALTSVKLSDALAEIPASTFESCNNLSEFSIPDNIKVIGERAFYNAALKNLVIPDSIDSIKQDAFRCGSIASLTLPENMSLDLFDGTGQFAASPRYYGDIHGITREQIDELIAAGIMYSNMQVRQITWYKENYDTDGKYLNGGTIGITSSWKIDEGSVPTEEQMRQGIDEGILAKDYLFDHFEINEETHRVRVVYRRSEWTTHTPRTSELYNATSHTHTVYGEKITEDSLGVSVRSDWKNLYPLGTTIYFTINGVEYSAVVNDYHNTSYGGWGTWDAYYLQPGWAKVLGYDSVEAFEADRANIMSKYKFDTSTATGDDYSNIAVVDSLPVHLTMIETEKMVEPMPKGGIYRFVLKCDDPRWAQNIKSLYRGQWTARSMHTKVNSIDEMKLRYNSNTYMYNILEDGSVEFFYYCISTNGGTLNPYCTIEATGFDVATFLTNSDTDRALGNDGHLYDSAGFPSVMGRWHFVFDGGEFTVPEYLKKEYDGKPITVEADTVGTIDIEYSTPDGGWSTDLRSFTDVGVYTMMTRGRSSMGVYSASRPTTIEITTPAPDTYTLHYTDSKYEDLLTPEEIEVPRGEAPTPNRLDIEGYRFNRIETQGNDVFVIYDKVDNYYIHHVSNKTGKDIIEPELIEIINNKTPDEEPQPKDFPGYRYKETIHSVGETQIRYDEVVDYTIRYIDEEGNEIGDDSTAEVVNGDFTELEKALEEKEFPGYRFQYYCEDKEAENTINAVYRRALPTEEAEEPKDDLEEEEHVSLVPLHPLYVDEDGNLLLDGGVNWMDAPDFLSDVDAADYREKFDAWVAAMKERFTREFDGYELMDASFDTNNLHITYTYRKTPAKIIEELKQEKQEKLAQTGDDAGATAALTLAIGAAALLAAAGASRRRRD